MKLKQNDKFTGKNYLLARVIFSYLLIGVVLLSALSFFLYNNFSRYSMAEIEGIAENMTLQYYNISDKLFSSIYNYFFTVYNTDFTHTTDFTIYSALYSNEFDVLENANIRRRLTSEVMANPWIHSIYIYNRRADAVFSNLSSVMPVSEFYDRDLISIINERRQIIDPVYIPRIMEYSVEGKMYRLNTLTILYADYSSSGIAGAAMAVNIDLRELQNIFITRINRAQIFILDRNGIVISHIDPSLITSDMSEVFYIKEILSGTEKSGCFITRINNQDNLVTFIKSDRALGWNFIRVDDMNELLHNMRSVQRNVLLLTFLFVLAGIIIAVYFTMGVYVPLDKRLKKLSMSVKKLEPLRKNYLLKRLLDGKTNRDELDELGMLTIDTTANGFILMIMGFDSFYVLNRQYPSETMVSFKYSIIKTALDVFNRTLGNINSIETYDNNDDHICFIMSLNDDSGEYTGKIKSAANEIINCINTKNIFSITISISDVFNYLRGAGRAYYNSLGYLNYKIILGCGVVITGNDISKMNFTQYEYPIKKEKHLIDSLMLCDKPNMEKQLDEIIGIIRNFTYDEIMMAFIQLALGSIRSIETVIDIQDIPTDLEYSNIFRNMARFDSLAAIRGWFITLYIWVIDSLSAKKDTRKDVIVGKLEEYINTNYANPNLSINLLADIAGLSANYIRVIYKEMTNRSLSSLISDIRLKKAAELLLTTNTSINQIPVIVGFQSSGYFYKNFKRHTGMTPDQYRKEKGKMQ